LIARLIREERAANRGRSLVSALNFVDGTGSTVRCVRANDEHEIAITQSPAAYLGNR